MSDPPPRVATGGQPEPEVRRLRTIAATRPPSAAPETVATKTASEHGDRAADDRGRASRSIQVDETLTELGTRFEGLTRVLDDIRQVSEGLPEFDVDSMT